METRSIEVEDRSEIGTSSVRRLRKAGNVPGVVYSAGNDAKPVMMDAHKYKMSTRGARATQLFKLASANKHLDGKLTLIKSVQIEPLQGNIIHVDFLELTEGHRITLTVPLATTGECLAVKENRAFLNQTAYEIEVECLPSAIPESLTIDISPLKEGGSLHASDVPLPAGVVLRSLPGMTVVSAMSMKALEEELPAAPAAADAAAAAAAAPGAAGAAPAAAAAPEKDKDKKKDKN